MKIKKVYLGQRQIYPDEPRTPGENTVFYIKWEWDITDYWPNHYTFTNNSVTINDDYLYFPWTNSNGLYNSSVNQPSTNTFNVRVYVETAVKSWRNNPRILAYADTTDRDYLGYWDTNSWTYKINGTNYEITRGTRFNLCSIKDNGTVKIYVNGAYISSFSHNYNSSGTRIWSKHISSYDPHKWRMAKIILESKARTDQEVVDYFNQTKSNYGL